MIFLQFSPSYSFQCNKWVILVLFSEVLSPEQCLPLSCESGASYYSQISLEVIESSSVFFCSREVAKEEGEELSNGLFDICR